MRVAVTNIAINIPEGLLCTITIPVYRHLVAFQQTQHHSHWSIAYVHLKPFFYQLSMLHIQNPDPCLSSTRSFLTAMNKTLFAKQNNNGSNMWKSPAHLEVNTSQRGMWWRWCRCKADTCFPFRMLLAYPLNFPRRKMQNSSDSIEHVGLGRWIRA